MVTYRLASSFPGHFYSGQSSSGSGLRTAASRVGSFLWQALTSPGEWRAGRGVSSSTLLPWSISAPHMPGVLFPHGVEGFYPRCGTILGDGGDISAGPPPEAPFLSRQFGSWDGCSPGWQLPGTASPVRVPARAASPSPGERGGGTPGWGKRWGKPAGPRRGAAPQSPACVGWASCAEARLGFAFPLAPIQKGAAVGKGGCCRTDSSFFSVLQALPVAEEVPPAAAAPPAPRCCCLR